MPTHITPDEEPEEPKAPEAPKAAQPKGKRRSLSGVRRELSAKELASPGVQKTLLDELERLDGDLLEAKGFQNRFYEADKRASVLEQKLTTHRAVEILSVSGLTGGAILVGYVPGIWENQPTAGLILAVGAIFIAGGLLAKGIRL